MVDKLMDAIYDSQNYMLQISLLTKDAQYIQTAKRIAEFVTDIYRNIEPSHYQGVIIVYVDFSNKLNFKYTDAEIFYDKGMLNNDSNSFIFQLKDSEQEYPSIWVNLETDGIKKLLETKENFIAYVFEDKKEYFIVNKTKIPIVNKFSCPSIFALKYHYVQEALLDYKNDRIRNVSCEHFKKCWYDDNWIYLKNKPEEQMQLSLAEFLKNRIRGIDVRREFNLGASKPVDIRIFWNEANRAALIEIKWLGQSLNKDDKIGTAYTNVRANDGMKQIKEYIDMDKKDGPSIISKGYLVVIDARRRNISKHKVGTITRNDGLHYVDSELNIDDDKQYWTSFPNIEKPVRMFVEPVCEV